MPLRKIGRLGAGFSQRSKIGIWEDVFMSSFLGTFLGILAGTIAVNVFLKWRQEKENLKTLKFELQVNAKKIDGLLDELTRCRNAANGDNMADYSGHFYLSRILTATANAMYNSGLLSKYLASEDIEKLQECFFIFSPDGEIFMNKQINSHKSEFNKKKAVKDIDSWELTFKKSKEDLHNILKKLP